VRLSYSSSTLLQGCRRKFWHKKIQKTAVDPDFEENTTALRLGKGFHQVLEDCNHEKSKLNKAIIDSAFEDNDILGDTEKGLILGMVGKYFTLHEKQGLKVVGCELEIGDEDIIGYVDAVMVDNSGAWYIVDLKTAARLSGSLMSRLSKDPQLNIYSYFAPMLAKQLNLDPDLFAGTRYRVTTKATIKRNKKETQKEFIGRIMDRVESYDIFVPKSQLVPEQVYNQFMTLLWEIEELKEMSEAQVSQNFQNCETYFKPCPYWSRCYGKTFTAASETHELFSTANAKLVQHFDTDLELLL